MNPFESPGGSWRSSEEQSARNVDSFASGEYFSLPPKKKSVEVHSKVPGDKVFCDEIATTNESIKINAEKMLNVSKLELKRMPGEEINASTNESTGIDDDRNKYVCKTSNAYCKDNTAEGGNEIESEDLETIVKVNCLIEDGENKTERPQSESDMTEKFCMYDLENGCIKLNLIVDDSEQIFKHSYKNRDNHEKNYCNPSNEIGVENNIKESCIISHVSESAHVYESETLNLEGKEEYQQTEPINKVDYHSENHEPRRRPVSLPVGDPPPYTESLDYSPVMYSLPSEYNLRRSVSLYALESSPFNGIVMESFAEQEPKVTRFISVPAVRTISIAPLCSTSYDGALQTTAVPDGFEVHPSSAFCKFCQITVLTTTSTRYNSGTYCCCFLMFFSGICCPLSCLPFILTGPNKVYHSCPRCNEVIGVHICNDK